MPGYRHPMPDLEVSLSAEPAKPSHPVVVAEFRDSADARQAMLDLEGIGIDANAVNLVDQPSGPPVQQIEESGELEAAQDTAKRYVGGGLIGAVIGALIGIGLGLALNVEPQGIGVVGGAIAGGISGFVLGGFWGGARALPVNPDALDTYTLNPTGKDRVRIEVRTKSDEQAQAAADVLRQAKGENVETGG